MVLACTIIIFACEKSDIDLTGPTGGSSDTTQPSIFEQSDTNADDDSGDQTSDDESEGPINAAKGKLVIQGNYGACEQKTNWPIDRMSIFRVLSGGNQTRIELYKNPPEGNIPCGFEIQIDCTVREPDPNARPGAHNLYASKIFTLDCRDKPPCTTCDPPPPPPPPPKCDIDKLQRDAAEECGDLGVKHIDFGECTFECNEDSGSCDIEGENPGEPCDDEGNGTLCFWDFDLCDWVCIDDETCEPCKETITDERTFFEGECEERVEVTITEFTDCHGNTRQERVETPAPEECPGPCDEEPTQCDEGFVLVEGNGVETCNECVPFCIVFPDADECQPPRDCIYEYGGPPADKEALCLALDNSAFWSDGSQHCVIPLPGVAADRWNLNPGQSHPDCLRKQDQD
jgi:hypothetical protein